MSIFDFFRSFFGVNRRSDFSTSEFGDHDSRRDSFRNPIWQSNDDDDDIDDFRHHGSGMHFNIFSDPIEMSRYFELQMDNMLKNFFGFSFSMDETIQALPFNESEANENLRDKMFKSATDKPFDTTAIQSIPPDQKIDTDLDGQIAADEFLKIWNRGNVETEKSFVPHNFSFRQFKKEIRRYDGTMEQKQIFEDSKGNKKTVVTREIGDKRYITTTIKDKNGVETKSETVFNIPESELKDTHFTGKRSLSAKNNINDTDSSPNRFPWEKFFGPCPKL